MISAFQEMKTRAVRACVFSADRAYRYTLWREWTVQEIALTVAHDVDPRPFEYVQFIGLNPSVADERIDDNTITRCIDFAKRWGFGALCMTNLFAWRDTDPKQMKRAVDPTGPDNDQWLNVIARDAALIVCCWGNEGAHRDRATEFLAHAAFAPRYRSGELKVFGLSKTGQPLHPLMLRKLHSVVPMKTLSKQAF